MPGYSSLDSSELLPGIYARNLLYGLSHASGRVLRFLGSGWRPALLWLLDSIEITVLGFWIYDSQVSPPFEPKDLFTVEVAAAALVIFTLGFILYSGWQSRQRVFVDTFEDHTGRTDFFTKGIPRLLTIELHRMNALYNEVDDRRSIVSLGGRKSPLDYAIKIDDTGDKLAGAFSADTKFKLGPVEIPAGLFAGVLAKLIRGPQITGALHRDGDLYILVAQMLGNKSFGWRVEGKITRPDAPAVAGSSSVPVSTPSGQVSLAMSTVAGDQSTSIQVENLDAMVRELAMRIFTDVTEGGTTRWRATSAFTQGLRDYRNCLLSPKDQFKNLNNAEKRFLEAISEDSTFDMAWYNLGVVQTELKRLDAAYQAFLTAARINPGKWEIYYALALNQFEKSQGITDWSRKESTLQEVIRHCTQALDLSPGKPQVHTLEGVCYRTMAINEQDPARKRELFDKASRCHRFAAKRAWVAWCADQFLPERDQGIRISGTQRTCWIALWDLARTYFFSLRCAIESGTGKERLASLFGPIERVLIQARSVQPANAAVMYELGMVQYYHERYDAATTSFEAATRISPTTLKYWSLLSIASARDRDPYREDAAIRRVLTFPDWLASQSEWIKKEMKIFTNGLGARIPEILAFQQELKNRRSATAQSSWSDTLLSWQGQYRESKKDWERGMLAYELGQVYQNSGQYKEANNQFDAAIKLFSRDHHLEISRKDIPLKQVQCLIGLGTPTEAVTVAEKFFAGNPAGFTELATMAEALFAVNDYERALALFESALLLKPTRREILISIGNCYRRMGEYSVNRAAREHLWKNAILYYELVRDLGKEDRDIPTEDELSLDLAIWVNLGNISYQLADYSRAIADFNIAQALSNGQELLLLLYLGDAHFFKRDYQKGEDYYTQIIKGTEKYIPDDQRRITQVKDLPSNERDQLRNSLVLKGGGLFNKTGSSIGDERTWGEIYCRALLGQAYSLTERDAGLGLAEEFLNRAERTYALMGSLPAKIYADILDRRGWMYFKRRDQAKNLDSARDLITQAVALEADAEYYLHLAYIDYTQSLETADSTRKESLNRSALAHCEHALHMTPRRGLEEHVKDLQGRIGKSPSPTT
jgi:tetratricopeptide (TPR) repeat protein